MKVIFLDIDGVLNHESWFFGDGYKEEKKANNFHEYRLSEIDPESVEMISTIVKESGAKVVISSSWRNSESLAEIKLILKEKGFIGEIIDKTPSLNFHPDCEYNYPVPRGCEIEAWLKMNKDILEEKVSSFKYVILDDDSDMLYYQKDKFVHINKYYGITPKNAAKAIKILKSQ